MHSHSFRSDKFTIEPGEDEATNPFCFGKSLASWLGTKFLEFGYQPEQPIPEDWGWCLVLQQDPFLLWIGCGNETQAMLETVTPDEKASYLPDHREIRWRCIVQAESPPWKTYFWLKLIRLRDPEPHVRRVEEELVQILQSEPKVFDLVAYEE